MSKRHLSNLDPPWSLVTHRLVQEVAEEVIPLRRNRVNPRVIKRKMSQWHKKRPIHCRPPQPTKPLE